MLGNHDGMRGGVEGGKEPVTSRSRYDEVHKAVSFKRSQISPRLEKSRVWDQAKSGRNVFEMLCEYGGDSCLLCSNFSPHRVNPPSADEISRILLSFHVSQSRDPIGHNLVPPRLTWR